MESIHEFIFSFLVSILSSLFSFSFFREELEFKTKRIEMERREFESLFFSYRGGMSFFRTTTETVDEDEDFSVLV